MRRIQTLRWCFVPPKGNSLLGPQASDGESAQPSEARTRNQNSGKVIEVVVAAADLSAADVGSQQQQQQQGQRRQRGSGAGSGSAAGSNASQRTAQVGSAAGAAAPHRAVQVGPVATESSSVQAPEGAPAATPVAEQGETPAAEPAGSQLNFEPADASRQTTSIAVWFTGRDLVPAGGAGGLSGGVCAYAARAALEPSGFRTLPIGGAGAG